MQFHILIRFLALSSLSVLLFACDRSMSSPSDFEEMAEEMVSKFSAPQVTQDEFQEMLSSDKIQIVDARELREFQVSHLQSAIHLGTKEFDLKGVDKLISKDKECVVYCSVGYRSGALAEQLIQQGYEAYNLRGGIFAWMNRGQLVYDEKEQVTKRIYGYNEKWSKWLAKGEVVTP